MVCSPCAVFTFRKRFAFFFDSTGYLLVFRHALHPTSEPFGMPVVVFYLTDRNVDIVPGFIGLNQRRYLKLCANNDCHGIEVIDILSIIQSGNVNRLGRWGDAVTGVALSRGEFADSAHGCRAAIRLIPVDKRLAITYRP
jgi:hypothetical protein